MSKVELCAPAKVNLALHVTGLRSDGYHLLDSLVMFSDVGDRLRIEVAETASFSVTGRFSQDVPMSSENSILRVVELLWKGPPLAITLEKNLPVASGIGGGSADAAACYRALQALRGDLAPEASNIEIEHAPALLHLGADMPMCVRSRTAHVSGVGEDVNERNDLPFLHVVFVNPGVAVSTPEVFGALAVKENTPMSKLQPTPTEQGFLIWLAAQRNDLEGPAKLICPSVEDALAGLQGSAGCQLARMSGSGATCFGIFASRSDAQAAANDLQHRYDRWWISPGELNGPTGAEPQLIRSTT
ncbi:MAG: 4-(cytidine 5'-diphospho)-2-C-methyl-D-erythritol kinase [Pseudomonadota bacterium]